MSVDSTHQNQPNMTNILYDADLTEFARELNLWPFKVTFVPYGSICACT